VHLENDDEEYALNVMESTLDSLTKIIYQEPQGPNRKNSIQDWMSDFNRKVVYDWSTHLKLKDNTKFLCNITILYAVWNIIRELKS